MNLLIKAGILSFLILAAGCGAETELEYEVPDLDEIEERIDVMHRVILEEADTEILQDVIGFEEDKSREEIMASYSASRDDFRGWIETDAGIRGRYAPSDLSFLQDVFAEYISKNDRFLDLGSGDGRVVFLAALFGAESVGIEYDTDIFNWSKRVKDRLIEKELIAPERVELIHGNYFDYSWSEYDWLYYYVYYGDPKSEIPEEEQEKLIQEMDSVSKVMFAMEPPVHGHDPFPELETTGYYPPRNEESDEYDPGQTYIKFYQAPVD